jgi:hypothetical protein
MPLQNGSSFSGGFTPIVQGCCADAFLTGQLGYGQTVGRGHLLEHGFLTFWRVMGHGCPLKSSGDNYLDA